jgi:hypothetical protein
MTVTSILTLIVAWMTEWTTTTVIMGFGIMMIFSAICFLAEFLVMGFTAKAGTFFWTAATCFLVAHYLPFPG